MEMEREQCTTKSIDGPNWRRNTLRKHAQQGGICDVADLAPVPFEKVESWLKSYNDWKVRLKYVQSELAHIPELTRTLHMVAAHSRGRKQETVLRTVIRRIQITEHEIPLLLSRISLIDYALTSLTSEEGLFVRLRYIDNIASSDAISRLALSRRAYFYHRKRILRKIYMKIKDRAFLLDLESAQAD
ncbi:MAG: hypothetical protein E7L01_04155 [Paenibacillus macerans]|uniref:Uncharacterized protein n=1 Tax=Paenibacillus macerans TaxID=44252 RepID=A0A090ZCT3_PAEMA|nr:hypothetical protein [Paenibacillus macerans]KFN08238.1 hypothetical protein DJ90_1636 [Paenibacillus macerans]MBS5912067.1 hypothetical protein [Paenibacillus macerans]MCY7557696.1 hypothetical protein [Paenibacillus macerans]MDU5945935.1 hypothetical protein [Paenibacillus macerans]MDU7472541.1 hypothetical protein [Paenibacillus macerans]